MHQPRSLDLWQKLRSSKLLSASFVLLTLSIGILIGTVVSERVGAADQANAAAPDAKPLVIPPADPVENQFTEIARKVRPSVVNIRVESIVRRTSAGGDEPGMDEFFRRFFGMPNAPGGFEMPTPRARPGEGSGVIVDANGYIITNRHVVEEADRLRVYFAEDEDDAYEAKVIGSDEETDIAVIKIEPRGRKLQAALLGNSDAVNVGDWAVAIGSPFGYRETVTAGIISAKGREVHSTAARTNRPFQKFFQTDAAINPGNSGGPLVNVRGEVIAINTAIVSRTGAYEGLGFALPSNVAVEVYNQIIRHGRVARGSIGIGFKADQKESLLRVHGAAGGGVFVTSVTKDWPAERAGIEIEDVIVAIDGEPINDGDGLIAVVAGKSVGSVVKIDVLRSGDRKSFDVEIADREELLRAQYGGIEEAPVEAAEASDVTFGFKAAVLNDTRRSQLDFEDEGVVVTEVEPASFAYDIGLLPKDVIVSINRLPVESIRDLREIQDGLKPGEDVAFKVMRRFGDEWVPQYPAGVLPESDAGGF